MPAEVHLVQLLVVGEEDDLGGELLLGRLVGAVGDLVQQLKRSQSGQWNVRYKSPWKGRWVEQLSETIAATLPDCRIRYAF
jgi:hypothetical protein